MKGEAQYGTEYSFWWWAKQWLMFQPHVSIRGRNGEPYLDRWHLWRYSNNAVEAQPRKYLHHFLASDPGRDPHDHPWPNKSIVLFGEYVERVYTPVDLGNGKWDIQLTEVLHRVPGDVVHRHAEWVHDIKLIDGPVWTLFFTEPKERSWGFWTEDGWVPWREYVTW